MMGRFCENSRRLLNFCDFSVPQKILRRPLQPFRADACFNLFQSNVTFHCRNQSAKQMTGFWFRTTELKWINFSAVYYSVDNE